MVLTEVGLSLEYSCRRVLHLPRPLLKNGYLVEISCLDGFLFSLFFFLSCSWFIVFGQSLLYSQETQLYTYLHSFLVFFSVTVYQRMLSGDSLLLKSLYSGTVLFSHSKYNSLFVTPDPPLSSSTPLLLHPSATTSLSSPSMSLSLFCLWVHLCHILDSACKWYHMVFVFLFLTYFTYNSLAVPMSLQTAFFLWPSLFFF